MSCHVCFADGHDVRTCEKSTRDTSTSASKAAAVWLHDESPNGSFVDAGHRFGITRDAVRQAWHLLYPDEQTPWQRAMRARSLAIREHAAAGMTLSQIARAVGASTSAVAYTCLANGITPRKATP